jgi:uncharacterized protein YneF (UPF0154 family)
MRQAIIINVVLTLIALFIHSYYVHRTFETNRQIVEVMEENKVIKETAIRLLEKEGVDLYFPRSITSFSGVVISLATLAALYAYSKSNGFLIGFCTALCAVFTSFIGGYLLFYVLLSEKSERVPKSDGLSVKNDWQTYIHDRSALN